MIAGSGGARRHLNHPRDAPKRQINVNRPAWLLAGVSGRLVKLIGRLCFFNLPAGNRELRSENFDALVDAGERRLSRAITR